MKKTPWLQLERYRVNHPFGSTPYGSDYGAFRVPGPCKRNLGIIANGEEDGWEHVSVSLPHRTPNWEEMAFVKDLFWTEDETVVQFHPPKSHYVNFHKHCLHLWRKVSEDIELPPIWMVGPKEKETA